MITAPATGNARQQRANEALRPLSIREVDLVAGRSLRSVAKGVLHRNDSHVATPSARVEDTGGPFIHRVLGRHPGRSRSTPTSTVASDGTRMIPMSFSMLIFVPNGSEYC